MKLYKLRKKKKYLIKEISNKNVVAQDLSAFVEEWFNGFDLVKNLQERKQITVKTYD